CLLLRLRRSDERGHPRLLHLPGPGSESAPAAPPLLEGCGACGAIDEAAHFVEDVSEVACRCRRVIHLQPVIGAVKDDDVGSALLEHLSLRQVERLVAAPANDEGGSA